MGTKTQKLSNVVDSIVEWQSVVTADGSTNTTAVAGRGYFIDTSSGAHTINLPASPKIGDVVKVSLITAGNTLTIGRNGNNINGSASDLTSTVDGDTYELVYVNASEGWKSVGQIQGGAFISATGGTVTTSGDFKIHSFTGDGCFVVSSVGNSDTNPAGGPSTVDYLVVAGGGGGGTNIGGGGGAGGFRESKDSTVSSPHTASPIAATTGLTITATTYPVTVGAGGAGSAYGCVANSGSNSVFSTITSTGGGYGGYTPTSTTSTCGASGGSGGGGSYDTNRNGGSGNTPPTSPPQGNSGGNGLQGPPAWAAGGGGGATGTGTTGTLPTGGPGGAGATTNISGSPVAYAGGGGGSGSANNNQPGGSGGTGGGGNGENGSGGGETDGTANTGGGGGGTRNESPGPGLRTPSKAGGSGIVIIRYKYQ